MSASAASDQPAAAVAPLVADPAHEIRITALSGTRGANFWSRRPVTRMDLVVGAFEDISSADVPGLTDRLVGTMPGLVEHRCSIGSRGGFVTRLRRGTYAPHIIEHIALELQTMVGHDVGYGRTRGGDIEGEYTLVFEHMHEAVGLRSAALALDAVQQAFAGTLDTVEYATTELEALAAMPDSSPLVQRVLCGITGGAGRRDTRTELARLIDVSSDVVVDVAPSYVLQAGLPYARSGMAIILDSKPTDVPLRYQEEERARRLVSVVIDAVDRDGWVIVPAKEWEIQDAARDDGCKVAIFADHDRITSRDKKVAAAVAWVEDERLFIDHNGELTDAGRVRRDTPAGPQAAAALAALVLGRSRSSVNAASTR